MARSLRGVYIVDYPRRRHRHDMGNGSCVKLPVVEPAGAELFYLFQDFVYLLAHALLSTQL